MRGRVNLEDKDGDFIQVSNEFPSPDCVEGIIDKVVLERLSSCIIATTKKTCSAENLSNLLSEKGLDEFEVRQVGGNQFVLDFDREELSDLSGAPLFAWNSFTFNNILNRLGEILYLEDEEFFGSDFSFKRAKILTNQLNFIEETLSLSCDGVVFPVRVREFRFSFWSNIDLAESNVAKSPKPPVGKAGDSSDSVSSVYSDFSSSLQPFREADKVDKCSVVARLADGVRAFQTMDEADDTANKECFNELIPEIGFINVGDSSNVFLKDHVLLVVAALEGSYVLQASLVADSHSRGGNVSVQTPMFASGGMDSFQCVTQNVLLDRARVDILSMGLLNEADDEVCEMVPCDNDGISWSENVDRAMNAKNQTLLRSARKILELDKRVGFQFIGNEDDVVKDLMNIELQNND
ncbi:hypothetical protein V6N11_084382 [Hibiscus sabdariffa]|uniref:Uncharacterized protein n=1 Tax=Hibiscus sabdariffa TaxID=183260 RepID=A0ABR2NBZ1_9ROSI